MKHPRLAALSVLAAGLLLTAGCGGGDANSKPPSESSPVPKHTEPKYSTYEEFPGQGLKRVVELAGTLGVKVKAVDSMWTAEFAGRSAEAGRHFLVVYVAVTPEEADRGTQHVSLRGSIALHITNSSQCDDDPGSSTHGQSCSVDAFPTSQLAMVPDKQWRTYGWEYNELEYADVEKGQTLIGAAAFDIKDDVNGTYKLCGRAEKYANSGSGYPCAPMPQPKNGSTR